MRIRVQNLCHNFVSMKIINIKKKKKCFEIEFSSGKRLSVLDSTKDEFNLFTNKEIDSKTFSLIKKENKIQEYFVIAVKRLLISDYSPNKLKEFLFKKGASKTEIDEVLKKLRKYSFLNEEEIIENVISFCDAKHYGFNRIISMLKARQIDEKKIAKVKYNLKREQTEALAQQNILVRKYKNKNTANLKGTVYSSLVRYGFDDEIASLCSSSLHNSTINELNMLKLDYIKIFSSYSRKLNGKELTQKLIDKLLMKGYRYKDIKKVLEDEKYEMD